MSGYDNCAPQAAAAAHACPPHRAQAVLRAVARRPLCAGAMTAAREPAWRVVGAAALPAQHISCQSTAAYPQCILTSTHSLAPATPCIPAPTPIPRHTLFPECACFLPHPGWPPAAIPLPPRHPSHPPTAETVGSLWEQQQHHSREILRPFRAEMLRAMLAGDPYLKVALVPVPEPNGAATMAWAVQLDYGLLHQFTAEQLAMMLALVGPAG